MRVAALLTVFLIILAFFITSCASNLQGKATTAKEQCISNDICGDNECGTCEACQSCYQDCCPNKCYDADGGNNAIQAGDISGIYLGEPFRHVDKCMSSQDLMEYYCGSATKEVPTNFRFECEKLGKDFLCKNGACISSTSS